MPNRSTSTSSIHLRRDILKATGSIGLQRWLRPGAGDALQLPAPVVVVCRREIDPLQAAVRQQLTLRHPGRRRSAPIRQIHLLDLPLGVDLRHAPHAFVVGGMGGMENTGHYPPPAYAPQVVSFGVAAPGSQAMDPLRGWSGHRHLTIGSGADGKASSPWLPLLVLNWRTPHGEIGLWVGLEWSGHWQIEVRSDPDGCFRLQATIPVGGLTLQPGETLALPTVHLGGFRGGREAGGNAVRRYIRERLTPTLAGRPVQPLLAYDHWMGMHGNLTAGNLRPQIQAAADLGLEYFIVDAGWFAGMEKGWVNAVGNWETENRKKFPRGLCDFADQVRAAGLKFGLWFEPERAMPGTDWLRQHPGWFLRRPGTAAGCLDLAQPGVVSALVAMLSRSIETLGIEWLRWDNNQPQGPYWEAADPSGKLQFAYHAGLYRVWDSLRARFPALVLDLGWRLDWAALKRCATSIMADYAEDPAIIRAMMTGGGQVLPGNYLNGFTYQGAADPLLLAPRLFLARMLGSMTLGGWISRYTPAQRRKIRRWLDGYRRFRHLLTGDIFSLTPLPLRPADPDIQQFVSSDGREAVIFAFTTSAGLRRLAVIPRQLIAHATYRVSDPIGRRPAAAVKGHTLLTQGLSLTLPPDGAQVWHLTSTTPSHPRRSKRV